MTPPNPPAAVGSVDPAQTSDTALIQGDAFAFALQAANGDQIIRNNAASRGASISGGRVYVASGIESRYVQVRIDSQRTLVLEGGLYFVR
ncbi:MAG TPA: hypothetical protein VEJ20_04225 [Candidatus Eremiobacteraceae bacterium]|nr:hypothetical protein [Candidatus Eremiobacteraceae bacterium]